MDLGCGCFGMGIIIGICFILGGLMNLGKNPQTGVGGIAIGVLILVIAYWILDSSAKRDEEKWRKFKG